MATLRREGAGRLRGVPPLLAMQAFAGPIIFHFVLRPFAEELPAFDPAVEDSVVQLSEVRLAGM